MIFDNLSKVIASIWRRSNGIYIQFRDIRACEEFQIVIGAGHSTLYTLSHMFNVEMCIIIIIEFMCIRDAEQVLVTATESGNGNGVYKRFYPVCRDRGQS